MALKKVGVFLGNAPEQSLKNQGIGRLLCFILSATKDCEIILAIPLWYKPLLIELLTDHNIHLDQYRILTTPCLPYLLRMRYFLIKAFRKPNINSFKQFLQLMATKFTVIALLKKAYLKINGSSNKNKLKLSTNSPELLPTSLPLFSSKIINPIIKGVTSSSFWLFSLTIIPFLILGLLGVTCIHLLRLWRKIRPKLGRVKARLLNHFDKVIIFINTPLRNLKHNKYAQYLYQIMRKQELSKLTNLINKEQDIPIWFVPTLFWPEANQIKSLKVMAIPDIVFVEFPDLFTEQYWQEAYSKIVESLAGANHLVCYSEHVKNTHLMSKFDINIDNISVINHGSVDLSKYLIKMDEQSTLTTNAKRAFRSYCDAQFAKDNYLDTFAFDSMQFILYPSQVRPHKNFLNLLKAYEILLRERYIGIKLIVTANLYEHEDLMTYIRKRRLQYDVLSLHHVSSEVLAALNHLATCVINPTLFEGSFPFTFTEAFSVGTPSIMSDIPVCHEAIHNEELKKIMLFDPYDVNDMVNKTQWAIENREQLYQLQKPLYDQLSLRSWEHVAQEYMTLFEKVANDRIAQ